MNELKDKNRGGVWKEETHTCREFKGDGIAKEGVVGEAGYACGSGMGVGMNAMTDHELDAL